MSSPMSGTAAASADSQVQLSECGDTDERRRVATTPPAAPITTTTSTDTPSSPTDQGSAVDDAGDAPAVGRKRRLSFKEKQRQSGAHYASASPAARSQVTADAGGSGTVAGVSQSPSSTTAASPVPSLVSQLDTSSPGSAAVPPANNLALNNDATTTTTTTTTSISTTTTAKATGCVFTALEPTRGGPRGAAKPPHRSGAAQAGRHLNTSTLSVSPMTSAEPSPTNKLTSPPDKVSQPNSFVHSPLSRTNTTVEEEEGEEGIMVSSSASASPSPLTLRAAVSSSGPSSSGVEGTSSFYSGAVAAVASTAAEGRRGEAEVGVQPTADDAAPSPPVLSSALMSTSPHGHHAASVEGEVSGVSASTAKVSVSTASSASPKLSFKERQRAAAAAAAKSASPSTRASLSSPVTQSNPPTASLSCASPKASSQAPSNSFLSASPNRSLNVAEPSVNRERQFSRLSPLPSTAAAAAASAATGVQSPTLKSPLAVAPAHGSGSYTLSGTGATSDAAARHGASPVHSIPRLPIDRIRLESSPHPSHASSSSSHQQSREATPLQGGTTAVSHSSVSSAHAAAAAGVVVSAPPGLTPVSTQQQQQQANSSLSSPTSRSTQSAPATAMARRVFSSSRLFANTPQTPITDTPGSTQRSPVTGNTTTAFAASAAAGAGRVGDAFSCGSRTRTSSQGEGGGGNDDVSSDEDDEDEENVALAFTQNATRLQLYDPNEPSPQALAIAAPRSQSLGTHSSNDREGSSANRGGGGGGGGASGTDSGPHTRSDTMVERSMSSAALAPSQRSHSALENEEAVAGSGGVHGGRAAAGGGGGASLGSGLERRAFATRRARTGSPGTPPPNTNTVPPSPSTGRGFAAYSPNSHSPRKMPAFEQSKPANAATATAAAAAGAATPGKTPRGAVVGHWRQHSRPPLAHAATLSGSHGGESSLDDTNERSLSISDARLGGVGGSSSRSRARRHRDKMLAPDGAVLNTPRTGRGGEGSAFAGTLTPRLHTRSRTVDDFALYASGGSVSARTGQRRDGAVSPATLTPGSVLFTAHPTPSTLVSGVGADHTVVVVAPTDTTNGSQPHITNNNNNSRSVAGSGHTGPLDASHSSPPLPLSLSTTDTVAAADGSSRVGRREQSGSPRLRGLVSFPALPPLHEHTNISGGGSGSGGGGGSGGRESNSENNHSSALSRVSFAMAAVLSPSGPSAENVSAATPMTVMTPVGYRSGDDGSTDASQGHPTEIYVPSATHEATAVAAGDRRTFSAVLEDVETAEGDYLLQTYNTYYAGETSLSATTAELRRSRRRSNYSSLHYGTMTAHHRRTDLRRARSGSAVLKGREQRRMGQRSATGVSLASAAAAEDEEVKDDNDVEQGLASTVLRQGARSSSDHDNDEESVCEQKGSEEDRERAEAQNEEAMRHGGGVAGDGLALKTATHGHHGLPSSGDAKRHMTTTAAAEEEAAEEAEAALRRRVGMWETIEHVFLPTYELVPDAASKEPLTGPGSPSSANPSGGAGASSRAETTVPDGFSPTAAALKSDPSSPKALSSHGLQLNPSGLLSPPMKATSPMANASPPALLPPSLSTENSPFMGPSSASAGAQQQKRPSGLVVLPDACDNGSSYLNVNNNSTGDEPNSSSSLSFSQFRKTPAQMAGTKRLEPEKFSFGTVAANYNMEPMDEQRLPNGACDAKAAARLIFDAVSGVMLMDPEDEGGRYEQRGHASPGSASRSSSPRSNEESATATTEGSGDGGDGACRCDAGFIAKDFKGVDCSRYDASELYDHCSRCHRRPAAFLCLHCLKAVCPSHVRRHHELNPTQCTLFLNLLDIMSSFDRIFWCEKCQQFTWKYTEVYDSLVDQIAYTRGTYLKHPARDIHCVGYEMRLKDATDTAALSNMAAAAAAATAASVRAQSEPSISDDCHISSSGSPARIRRAVSGSSLTTALQGLPANPHLATFPTLAGSSIAASSPQLRSGTPPVTVPSMTATAGYPLAQPTVLGVNNLLVFGASPASPMAPHAAAAASHLHANAVGTPSLHPLRSPMQNLLTRDTLDMSTGRAVTVGEPVTKLCALGASVQGWRTTQEDAEAVFLVDIPALSKEVVNRKELRAVAAAAAEKKKKKEKMQQQQQRQQQSSSGGTPATARGGGGVGGVVAQTAQCGSLDEANANANEEAGRSHSQSQRETSVVVHDTPEKEIHTRSTSTTGAKADARGQEARDNNLSLDGTQGGKSKPRQQHDTPLVKSANDKNTLGGNDGDEEAEEDGEDDGGAKKETIPMAVFCVFDGHGGDAVAKLAARHFETHLRRAIASTRADDVRARALLFYLSAESNAAALAGPQPALTAIPGADGSVTFFPAASATAALAAVQRGMACSPPQLSASPPVLVASPLFSGAAASTGVASSGTRSKLLVPGNSLPRAYSGDVATPSLKDGEEENEMPQILEVPDTMLAESLPVVMPVTAASLRLHMAASAVNYPGSGEANSNANNNNNNNNAPGSANQKPPRSTGGQESNGQNIAKNRRSNKALDAWADMEDPQADMTTAAAAAAASVASPAMAKLMAASMAASPELRHFGATLPQAAMAASCGFCASPSAWVSIPEMEMLRQYFASIMEDALLSLDDYLRSTPEGQRGDYDCVGCTACVVGITANFVLCANVGDSGAAFYTKDRIKVISVKHRVSDEAEQKRINAAGYSIVNDRIEGMSAVPRALGDFDFKQCGGRGPHEQAVSAVPDVTIMPTPSDTDQWGIILACDGVWDTATLHQVHVALTNTVNDLDVASSATEAVLRGAELYERHLRGPAMRRDDSLTSSRRHSPGSIEVGPEGGVSPSPAKRRAVAQRGEKGGAEDDEESLIGDYACDERFSRRLPQVDPILLTAAAGVFAQCVAPGDNDEGVGLDNCSLILVERRNVQE